MLRIGDVAKKYNISNRTLRYWEDKGILKSIRTENGYRFFDDENAVRIKQIVLLRKLKMPIADIERMFLSDDIQVVTDTLTRHWENLKQEEAVHALLAKLVERLIHQMGAVEKPGQAFTLLEEQTAGIILAHNAALQIMLSERVKDMSIDASNVRIVRLPAMTVASYHAASATPEEDCASVFNNFVLDNQLHQRNGYRYFGFNNPSPSDGNPVYGYEMWVTVPEDYAVPSPLQKKQFFGGLYASVSTHMNEIGERWQLLYDWCVNNAQYAVDPSSQWLEECSMDFEVFIADTAAASDKQLDLLAPIKLK